MPKILTKTKQVFQAKESHKNFKDYLDYELRAQYDVIFNRF